MAQEGIERRLAAILSADVVGYSRLMEEDEDGTLSVLLAHRAESIDPTIAAHRGPICILDAVSGEAIGTETIRYGQRVVNLSLPAAPVLTSDEGLANVGPWAFGHDMDYVALHPGPS